jgi:hypothetical protein
VADTEDYVSRARARIMEVLDIEHAVVHSELESRIAEAAYRGEPDNIDPHHVTTALRQLGRAGTIEWLDGPTRGGQTVTTIQPTNTRLRKTSTAKAAARKRLLQARYNGWAQGTKRHPHGLIGPAGEAALRSAILASGALQPAASGAGEVIRLHGVTLPGPLDSAGYLVALDSRGIPQPPVTVLFEVKNTRSWIYPSAPELYQLLHKAAVLHTASPEQPVVAIFACRRAHPTTFWMAKQLGFVAIEMNLQFAGDVDKADVLEVRNGLHFIDLTHGLGPSLRIRDRLTKTLPHISADVAKQWAETMSDPDVLDLLGVLRRSRARNRDEPMASLRRANELLGRQGGW